MILSDPFLKKSLLHSFPVWFSSINFIPTTIGVNT